MQETSELRTAIENLYEMFAAYPLRADTNACACCHSAYDEQRLHMKPLRKLNADDLRQYAGDALFVWGEVDDFKHFLPRIFELEVEHGDSFVDPQVAFGKLNYGEWRRWSDAEQRCIEHFLKVLWDGVLETEPPESKGMEIEDWLCGIAQAEAQLSPCLGKWLEAETDNARLNLAAFIAHSDFAKPNRRPSDYWNNRPELFDEVAAWVRSEAVKVKMSKIAAEYPHYDFVESAYISLP
jgi:hypothetical protein